MRASSSAISSRETGKVFQVGSQQRSECGLRFLKAIAIVQSGRLGDKIKATASIGGGPVGRPVRRDRTAEGP